MNLDIQQQVAATTESARALVLSSAGSGKTRVLIERIAYLVEKKGVSPYEIMSFSFTRKASQEIRDRLVERIGNQAYHCQLGTMHSIALQMIQRFGDVIGLKSRQVTVYDDWEADYLLRDVAMSMGLHTGKSWKKVKKSNVDEVFDRYYQTGESPDELNPVYELFVSFFARCRENNSKTYGSLLAGLRALIPTMVQYLNIKHILVDEIQDIDVLQWKIIREMESLFKANLFVVGDLDQSIYSFRGACPEYLLDHQDEFDIYRLENNYRSLPCIVDAANKLISNNVERIPGKMVATREGIHEIHTRNNSDSKTLRKYIEFLCLSNTTPTVLSRNHALLLKLSSLLEEAHIEHRYIGKETKFTNSEEFRRFHAFLKLMVNPYDNFAFLLIKDIIGITPEEYTHIRKTAAYEGKSHFQVYDGEHKQLFENAAEEGLLLKAEAISEEFTFNLASDTVPILIFIDDYIKQTGSSSDIQGYLDWLATIDIQDEVKEDYKGITLMTIHAAKGLEWDTVIVAGCNEEIIPSKQAIAEGNAEEERRLMYVAVTRARDNLILTVRPEVTEVNGRVYENPISRFIGEMV